MTNQHPDSSLSERDWPVEVTPAMLEAGVEALEAGEPLTYSGLVWAVYLAMARASSPSCPPGVRPIGQAPGNGSLA